MAALNLLKSDKSDAYFTFLIDGEYTSQLVVDTDRQLSIRHMKGEGTLAEIPLGQASKQNLDKIHERLWQLEELIKYIR